MTIKSDGNVGIGTTSPASIGTGITSLDIQGSNAGGIAFGPSGTKNYIYGASTMYVEANTTAVFVTSGTEKMRLTTGGQLIVGGTTVGYSGTKLQVGNTSDSQNGLNILTSTTGYGYILFGDGEAADTYVGQIWYYHGDNYMGFQTNGSEKLRITSAGNVGIGTTAPGAKLDIQTSSTNLGLRLGNTNGTNWDFYSYNDSNLYINNATGTVLTILNSNGNVGIGTAAPGYKLQVNGDAAFFSAAGSLNSIITQGSEGKGRFYLYDGGNATIALQTNGLSYFNAGNVGIGTTSPATKLHVVGYSRNDGGLLLNGSDADYREMIFTTSSAARWNLYAYGGEGGSNAGSVLYLARYADNGDYIANVATFLRTNGYVGIATITPTEQLHVSGNVRVTGAYYDSSNSAGSSGQVLSSTGSGTDWVSLSEISGVDGTGTANYVAKWSDADTITNSIIRDDGTTVGIGQAPAAAKLSVETITTAGETSYGKSYASLDTTGVAVAGLSASTNGQSALFTFTCYGGESGFQRIVYSCYNDSSNWFTSKVIDEGTNTFDVTASANGSTITFTYKARTSGQGYSPRILIQHLGSAINTSYL
jgi:hypothetical protein